MDLVGLIVVSILIVILAGALVFFYITASDWALATSAQTPTDVSGQVQSSNGRSVSVDVGVRGSTGHLLRWMYAMAGPSGDAPAHGWRQAVRSRYAPTVGIGPRRSDELLGELVDLGLLERRSRGISGSSYELLRGVRPDFTGADDIGYASGRSLAGTRAVGRAVGRVGT